MLEKLVKGMEPLHSPVLPGADFAEIAAQFDKSGIAFVIDRLLPL
jgi:hypothetical protein